VLWEPLAEVKAEIEYFGASGCDRLRWTSTKHGKTKRSKNYADSAAPSGKIQNTCSAEASSTNFFQRYRTPAALEVLIGRNNRQNDPLTFRLAGDYDLWFHAQEIPGSHEVTTSKARLCADEADLQIADLEVPTAPAKVVKCQLSEPKHVYKPKGAKPGIADLTSILGGSPSGDREFIKLVGQKSLSCDFRPLHLSF